MLMSNKIVRFFIFVSSPFLVFVLKAGQPAAMRSAELSELAIREHMKFDREQAREYKQRVKERKFAHKSPSTQYCTTGELRTLVHFTQGRHRKLYEREKQKVQRNLLAAVNTAVTTTLERRGLHPEDVNVHV
jgi:hypothetical protein